MKPIKQPKIGQKKKIPCPECDGAGCQECKGTGKVEGKVVINGHTS